MTKHFFRRLLFIICLVVVLPAYSIDKTATVIINPTEVKGEVNRNILGNNIIGYKKKYNKGRQKLYFDTTGGGIWNPVSRTFDQDYLQLIKQAGVSVLRWPGGPWLDSLEWKNLVGDPEKRPKNTFGLPEYLALCREIDAKPVITLPTKAEQLAQIPGLIEYLNSPDDGSNPNGGTDWASVRASDGQVLPWNVTWFEFGNETFGHNMSPEEYVNHYNNVYSQIMAIDSSVKLGAVFEDSDNITTGWNKTIVSRLGSKMGFVVIHPYFAGVNQKTADFYSKETIALSAMAADELIGFRLQQLNKYIIDETGRSDLGLVATEYNGNFVQNKPLRYRFTLFNAIHNADYVRIMLDPASNILFANHFQLLNSYWGMIREKKKNHKPLVKQANYYVYEIYNKFLSDKLVGININSPEYTFSGAGKVSARKGSKAVGAWKPYQGELPDEWTLRMFSDVEQEQDNGILTVKFNGEDLNYYHARKYFSVKPDALYRVSVKVKAVDIRGGKVGIAVEDVRGWSKTFYQPSNIQLKGSTDWHWLSAQIRTLPDTKKLRVMARRLKGKGEISGVAKFGELRVEENTSQLGKIQSVVGVASKANDDSFLSVILLNKDLNQSIKTKIKIPQNYKISDALKLSGESPFSSNFKLNEFGAVSITKLEIEIEGEYIVVDLPASSMSGIAFEKKSN